MFKIDGTIVELSMNLKKRNHMVTYLLIRRFGPTDAINDRANLSKIMSTN